MSLEQHLIEGQFEEAEALMRKWIADDDFASLYEGADTFIQYGFFEQAALIFQEMREHFVGEDQLYIDEASMRFELGEEEEAIRLLEEVDEESDEYLQALLLLADHYESTGLIEAAMQKMEEAYRLEPHEPIIQYGYAELLTVVGKYREAVRFYEQLRDSGIDTIGSVSLTRRLAETLASGAAYEEAIPYYEEWIAEEEVADAYYGLAYAYFQLGNVERATPRLETLLEMDKDYFSAYALLGQCYAKEEENDKAYATYVEGIARDRFNKTLYLAAGKMAVKLQRVDDAMRHFEEVLALDPEHIEAREALAALYEGEDRFDLVIELLEDEDNKTPHMEHELALAYEEEERFEEARESYERAYPALKEEVAFLHDYASFLIEEGERDKALALAKEIVKRSPEREEWSHYIEQVEWGDE